MRDMKLAVEQLSATIQKQLVDCPPMGHDPVQGLTEAHTHNLAAHVAGALDEYGRVDLTEAQRLYNQFWEGLTELEDRGVSAFQVQGGQIRVEFKDGRVEMQSIKGESR